MGWHTNVRDHLHPLRKQIMSWNNANTLARRAGWVAYLGPWYGLSNRVNRELKCWAGVGEWGCIDIA